MEDNKFVLEVSDLHTTFKTDNGDVSAVNINCFCNNWNYVLLEFI